MCLVMIEEKKLKYNGSSAKIRKHAGEFKATTRDTID